MRRKEDYVWGIRADYVVIWLMSMLLTFSIGYYAGVSITGEMVRNALDRSRTEQAK